MSGAAPDEWLVWGVPHSVLIEKPFLPMQVTIAVTTLMNKTDGV